MNATRWSAVVLAAVALVVAPVVTPVWAAPHPVAPTVHRTPLAGVDDAALRSAPAALDPAAAAAADQGATASPTARSGGTASTARAATTTRPAVFTAPLDTGRFTAAGVSWRPATPGSTEGVTVQVRVREAGAWSDWRVLDVEGGPDAGTAEAQQQRPTVATQPYSSPNADAIQVRVDTDTTAAPPELNLVTVDPGTSSADANLQSAPAGTAHSAAAQPTIVSRAGWGADESLRDCTPSASATIKVGFVHHTAGSNSYTAADSAGLVRGIYAYHVQGNGWCDIGYNFLVDRFGTRFEGRYGSLTQPIIGAHTLAFNKDSFAVSAMGDFTTAAAPAAMMTSISQILGWKLSLYGRDPKGTDTLTSAGGTGAKWPAGTVVRFNVVSGHRDAYATGCPGDVVYDQLASVRDATAQYIAGTGGAPSTASAIDQKNASLGGLLGSATGPEVAVAGGAVRPYQRGNIYWSASTGAHYVWGALLTKYLSLGGPGGWGFPTTDEVGVAGGARGGFTKGALLWSSATGTHLVWGAHLVKYDSLGGPTGIGFPTTDEVSVAGGSRASFTGGSLFWSGSTGSRLVYGGNLVKYDGLGGPGTIGFPTSDEVALSGGTRQPFTGGSLYWSTGGGSRLVYGANLVKYGQLGGPGGIGFPTADEVGVPGGTRQAFGRGTLVWSDPTGSRLVYGGNLVKYDALGGPAAIGFPTSDEVGVTGGTRQPFTRGALVWSTATGTRLVWGALLVKYDALGGPGFLGFPTTDEVGVAGGARQTFTRGSLFWTDRTAAHFVWGDILRAYDGAGGPAGDLGFPTSDEYGVPGGARNDFERGRYIDWTAATGAVVH